MPGVPGAGCGDSCGGGSVGPDACGGGVGDSCGGGRAGAAYGIGHGGGSMCGACREVILMSMCTKCIPADVLV